MPYLIVNDKCDGCSLCARYCPVLAINGELKSCHCINPRRCLDCGVCGRACSKSAIIDSQGNMAVKIPRKEWPTPEIDEKRCSACSMCIGVCRFQALGISLAYAYGEIGASACLKNAKACVGCGLCSQECPLNCIRMVVVS